MKFLKLLGAEFEQVGPFVQVGDDVDWVDDARVGHAVGHDRLDRNQFVWVRRDVREEVPAYALDRLQLWLIQDKFAELLPRGTQCDEVWPDLLTGGWVDGMDPPVEDNGADHLVWGRTEDLAQGAERDLGNDTLVDQPDLCWRPGYRLYDLAGLDVPERFLLRNDVDRWQVPLHGKERGFGHVPRAALGRETSRVGRQVQHGLDVLADSEPIVLTQPGRHLIDMRIVGRDLAFCLLHPPLISAACVSHLLRSLVFPPPMVFLSLLKLLPGRIDRRLVLLLTTEHTAQPPYRLGFEVSPFRSWNRNGKIPQVQGRHSCCRTRRRG